MNEKKLKILIINYEFPPLGGGGGVATYDLALEWKEAGQVDVLTSNFADLPSYENMDGINVYRTRIFFRKSRDAATFISMLSYVITGFFKGIKLARKNRYDVINTHFAVPSGPLGYIISRLFRIPNVLSLHGGDIYDPSKKLSPHDSFIFSRVVKFILQKADRIVAQSTNTRDNTVKYYNPDRNVEIIPLAFHPPADIRATRKELNLTKDYFYVITVGRLIKRKSLQTLIRAMGKIKNKKIKLLIIGDGPEKEYLESVVKECKADDRITFLGFLDDNDKYRYLKCSDLFALTSLHEGFGIVFMEAMHIGLPIACTNHGGQVDFLKQRENAILFDVGDVDKCAEAIVELHKDEKLYKKLSANNRKKIKDFYAEHVASQYIDIFKELISR
ncbi:MAG TPA: glycosyltransferase family 4 protein [Spirochaetota bacterium]|nr:glycosyltransferase family 4 protein [Spirochaetota bacterium]HPJ40692.1 glycosyltransferase family 4 protein [Spirochaetota bacterium]